MKMKKYYHVGIGGKFTISTEITCPECKRKYVAEINGEDTWHDSYAEYYDSSHLTFDSQCSFCKANITIHCADSFMVDAENNYRKEAEENAKREK